jgi:Rha family phage regulatory protein
MNQLIIMHDRQAVTSSVNVAETFGKRHDNVLRDIAGLLEIEEAQQLFQEAVYEHPQNKQRYKMFYMNRDGFTLLAMGFTGKEALQFKLKFIEAFNEMEKQQLPKPMTPSELALLQAQNLFNLESRVDQHQTKLETIEKKVDGQITLDHGEQRRLQRLISSKVFEHAKTDDHKRLLYPELHREIKDRFGVASYKDVKRHELQSAIRYVESWIPRKVS